MSGATFSSGARTRRFRAWLLSAGHLLFLDSVSVAGYIAGHAHQEFLKLYICDSILCSMLVVLVIFCCVTKEAQM